MQRHTPTPPPPPSGSHGGPRGLSLSRRSSLHDGRFGSLFRTLPAATWSDDDLKALSDKVSAPAEDTADADKEDGEENFGIPAGYTYFGQFVDHDLTFDPASNLQQLNDPNALEDFRTPRFDLDCLYGRGPDDQPYLYGIRPEEKTFPHDSLKLLFGEGLTFGDGKTKARSDLQRNVQGRALIGDKRNDENVIVSQFHAGMMAFHNHLVEVMRAEDPDTTFEQVAQEVRFHYQWAVLNDFLKRLVKPNVLNHVAPFINKGSNVIADPPHLRFYHYVKEPFIPVEFSVAAYRLGHSMVRPIYRLSRTLEQKKIFADLATQGLNGFGKFPSSWGIEWDLFFGNPARTPDGNGRVMPSYKLDTSLVDPLSNLPEFIQKDKDKNLKKDPADPTGKTFLLEPDAVTANLTQRNLMRGRSMGLPSGQSIAQAMGIVPLRDDQILIGKATAADWPKALTIDSISKNFTGNAPLWIYILAEAAHEWQKQAFPNGDHTKPAKKNADRIPVHLGDVGSIIVAETFLGLMLGDGFSYLKQNPLFMPRKELTQTGNAHDFGVFDLVRPR